MLADVIVHWDAVSAWAYLVCAVLGVWFVRRIYLLRDGRTRLALLMVLTTWCLNALALFVLFIVRVNWPVYLMTCRSALAVPAIAQVVMMVWLMWQTVATRKDGE